jgi:hypothetical protein
MSSPKTESGEKTEKLRTRSILMNKKTDGREERWRSTADCLQSVFTTKSNTGYYIPTTASRHSQHVDGRWRLNGGETLEWRWDVKKGSTYNTKENSITKSFCEKWKILRRAKIITFDKT